MPPEAFSALVVRERDGAFDRAIEQRVLADLPPGDVLIRVHYSSLNYKDALSASGNKGVTRCYPHTPGIDAAGIVAHSEADAFRPGQAVLVTGYDLGMNTAGGFAEFIRVPAEWVVPLPGGLSLRETMIIGTAGFTAALSLRALQDGGVDAGCILVTGATGGVGSLAVMLASAAGYTVTAVTGKRDRHDWLRSLGASEVVAREDVLVSPEKLMLKPQWHGVIDTVGGPYLDAALRATRPHGVVTTCGNVASPALKTNVYPFILRGIRLQGIDSAMTPMPHRREVWTTLAHAWKPPQLDVIATETTLAGLGGHIDSMLQGGASGRVVVRLCP